MVSVKIDNVITSMINFQILLPRLFSLADLIRKMMGNSKIVLKIIIQMNFNYITELEFRREKMMNY